MDSKTETDLAARLLAVTPDVAVGRTGRVVGEWSEWVEETGFSFWARLADSNPAGYDLVDADLDDPTEEELLAILAS